MQQELHEYENELNEIAYIVDWHSVGIVAVTSENKKDESTLLGSGTIVRIENTVGILTAYHVTDLSRKVIRLGFVTKDYSHNITIDRKYLNILEVAKPRGSDIGPDLSFIILPEHILAEINTTKMIYDLDRARKYFKQPRIYSDYAWMIYGYPGELTKIEGAHGPFHRVNVYISMWYACLTIKVTDKGFYELVDLQIPIIPSRAAVQSFGGVSGGGLWCIPISRDNEKKILFEKPIFAGVAFYEMIESEEIKYIRCNGPKGLFGGAFEIIAQNNA